MVKSQYTLLSIHVKRIKRNRLKSDNSQLSELGVDELIQTYYKLTILKTPFYKLFLLVTKLKRSGCESIDVNLSEMSGPGRQQCKAQVLLYPKLGATTHLGVKQKKTFQVSIESFCSCTFLFFIEILTTT